MNIEQTKCDHCGKIHNTPNKNLHLGDFGLIAVRLDTDEPNYRYAPKRHEPTAEELKRVPRQKHFFDFCNEDCLREFLIKRNDDKRIAESFA